MNTKPVSVTFDVNDEKELLSLMAADLEVIKCSTPDPLVVSDDKLEDDDDDDDDDDD